MLFKDGDTIVFAGDSTTDAGKLSTGDRLGTGYVRLLNGMLNAFCPEVRSRVVNAGVSGNTSADLLARTVISPGELPAGIFLAIVGVPFFIFLLVRRKKHG